MKKKNILLLLLSLLLILSVIVSGCSAVANKDTAPREPEYANDYNGSLAPDEDMDLPSINPDSVNPADPSLPRRVIKNADMTIVSTDPVKTKSDIESKASSLGGFVSDFSQQINNYIYIQMTVEVPGDKLDLFLRQIGDSGVKIERQSVTSEDVTDSYYDTETRLATTRDLLNHYREMLSSAETIDETLQVQAKIDQLTLELESLQGRLNRLELLTSNSRVYIDIYQEKDPLLEKPSELEPLSWQHVKYFISNGFSRLGTILLLLAQYLFIGIAVGFPVILVVVLIILIIYFTKKRKKKKALAALAAAEHETKQKE
ncbi:MAG: DUF4349 domain-containing protein [Clostridiaceae bacterium]|nr:DUF4349 domain-containing protein [Clostridiaceae bacterium]